ncbi:hypothetical protein BST61_g10606 [Cercospora zeina]
MTRLLQHPRLHCKSRKRLRLRTTPPDSTYRRIPSEARRKRWSSSSPGRDTITTSSEDGAHASEPILQSRKPKYEVTDEQVAKAISRKPFVHRSTSAYPHWMYRRSKFHSQAITEHEAVTSLQSEFDEAYPMEEDRPEYTYYTVENFTIYQPPGAAWHGDELVTLEKLTMLRKSEFYFAGEVSFANTSSFVKDVPFDVLTLEYGDDSRPWRDRVCIQSKIAKMRNFYYKLGRPAVEYLRFYTPFLSIAQFTDYFIEYMCDHENVTIAHFRCKFWSRLRDAHGEEKSFKTWHKHILLQDFRTLVAVNVDFLWKESWDIDSQSAGSAEPTALRKHPLWREIHPDRLKAITAQPVNYDGLTVVTSFAHSCFQSLYFADMLGMHPVTEELRERVNTRKTSLGLTPLCNEDFPAQKLVKSQPLREVMDVQAGDVVVVTADRTGDWKLSTADLWYAYVQRVWQDLWGSRRLDVLWLYQPEDTTIGNAFYPYKQELFLSDNCGCGKQEALHLNDIDDVVGKAEVSWFVKDPNMVQQGFFVRRTFRTVPELNQYDFVTLENHHFTCCHQEGFIDRSVINYNIGDAVLVHKEADSLGRNCEPAIIVGFLNDQGRDHVLLQRLEYAKGRTGKARPNELILIGQES